MTDTPAFPAAVRDELLSSARFDGATWYYDPDGDCIEFLASGDRFYAKRADNWVTAYYSYKTDELIGAQIKGVLRLVQRYPSLEMIDIHEGRVRLALLFRISAYSSTRKVEEPTALVYRNLIRMTEDSDAEVELAIC